MIVLDLSLLFDDVLVCLSFCWCPCMAINNVSVHYGGGFLPDIILLTQQCYYHRGTRLNAVKEVLYFQLLIPPKRFDIFSPRLGDAQKV